MRSKNMLLKALGVEGCVMLDCRWEDETGGRPRMVIGYAPEASPHIFAKIAVKPACSRRISSKAIMSGSNHSSRIVGIAEYQNRP